jgi:hypothetical protein
MLDRLTLSDFEPLVGQGFRSAGPECGETLTLVAAKPGPGTPPPGRRAGFSLLFESEGRAGRLKQGTHRLEHAAMAGLELFLVPLGPNREGRFQYEAVFT